MADDMDAIEWWRVVLHNPCNSAGCAQMVADHAMMDMDRERDSEVSGFDAQGGRLAMMPI